MRNDNQFNVPIYFFTQLIAVLFTACAYYLAFRNSGSGAAIRVESMNNKGEVKGVSAQTSIALANASQLAVPEELRKKVLDSTNFLLVTSEIMGLVSGLDHQDGHYNPLCLQGKAANKGLIYLRQDVVEHPAHLLQVLKLFFFEAMNLVRHTEALAVEQCNVFATNKSQCLSTTYPWDTVEQGEEAWRAFQVFMFRLSFFVKKGLKYRKELTSDQIELLQRCQLAMLSYVSPPEGPNHMQRPFALYDRKECDQPDTESLKGACFNVYEVPEGRVVSAEAYGRASLLSATIIWHNIWVSLKHEGTLSRNELPRGDVDPSDFNVAGMIGIFHTLPREVRAEFGPEMCDYLAGYWGAPSYCKTF